MKIITRRRKRIDIADSGALSDLAFLLIIFFIVIAVFNVNNGFILGLPGKNSQKIVNAQDLIKVMLNENGTVSIDEQLVSLSELELMISDNLIQRPNMTVLLNIHSEVPYQQVVSVIEVVRKLDVDNFSFKMIEDGV